jgi:hypothetical protein
MRERHPRRQNVRQVTNSQLHLFCAMTAARGLLTLVLKREAATAMTTPFSITIEVEGLKAGAALRLLHLDGEANLHLGFEQRQANAL